MIARALICVALLFASIAPLSLASAQSRDPILVPEISQHQVSVRQGFTGTELLLYGAILDPDGRSSSAEYDIVVVLKGRTTPILLREKQKVLGMWVNGESTRFRSAPSYFAMASSRPIEEIVEQRTAIIYELGLDFLQLSPTGTIDPAEQARFTNGLVDLRQRQGLYREDQSGVSISQSVLYQARIELPDNVLTGRYTAETFAIIDGRVVTSATSHVEVVKEGIGGAIVQGAEEYSFLYGLMAVALSLFMGWAAGRLFSLI